MECQTHILISFISSSLILLSGNLASCKVHYTSCCFLAHCQVSSPPRKTPKYGENDDDGGLAQAIAASLLDPTDTMPEFPVSTSAPSSSSAYNPDARVHIESAASSLSCRPRDPLDDFEDDDFRGPVSLDEP